MKISFCSIPITDYDKALSFYTDVMGFVKKHDIPLGGGARWLTVVSPDAPNGTEIRARTERRLSRYESAQKASLMHDGIPYTGFQVDDIQKEYARLKALGVEFTMEPTNMGTTTMAILNDTCGNLIQIFQMTAS